MYLKVQDDNQKDKMLIESDRIQWEGPDKIRVWPDTSDPTRYATFRLNHGDRVFIMNNDGKTIDSKRIILHEC